MAAAAAGNGPLAPHMLSYVPRQCAGSIGYNVTVKRIWVSPAMSRYKSLKGSRWCGDDDMNLASTSECLGDLYWLIPSELHIRLTGASYSIDPTHCRGTYDSICGARGPFPAAAAMVMSCCWWLAVGCRCVNLTYD